MANLLTTADGCIEAVPSIHQRSAFAQEVRRRFLAERFDAVAVELPPSLCDLFLQGVKQLPNITAVVYHDPQYDGAAGGSDGEEQTHYLPIDPCDSIVEAARLAEQERIPLYCIDQESTADPEPGMALPDEYAVRRTGLSAYYGAIREVLDPAARGSTRWSRENWMGLQLRHIVEQFAARAKKRRRPVRVLYICGLNHWEGVRTAYENHRKVARIPAKFRRQALYQVAPDSLYFLLGELPYHTYLFEKSRYAVGENETGWEKTDALKELLLATRQEYLRDLPEEKEFLAPARLQCMLTYMRNMTLLKGRLTPDLYTIVIAAKGCAGGGFAAKAVEMAKYYPYMDPLSTLPTLRAGIGKLELPDTGVLEAQNFFPMPPMEWRNIPLRKLPKKEKKAEYRYRWNPSQQCSWPPEDEKIENFRAHVFDRALQALGHEAARVEKFATSFKDGIDLRETLRNWHTGEIYVKELPPVRGDVDALIFLFDDESSPHGGGPEENKYPWRTTWYAEHENESTLCFYATDWKENMIGPGVARARYGGCLFLFPPRPIPNLWTYSRVAKRARSPGEVLVFGGLIYARERNVVVVSAAKPSLRMREEARRLDKRIVHLPLSMFSKETLHRLRMVHVLNGKAVRSYAAKFIEE